MLIRAALTGRPRARGSRAGQGAERRAVTGPSGPEPDPTPRNLKHHGLTLVRPSHARPELCLGTRGGARVSRGFNGKRACEHCTQNRGRPSSGHIVTRPSKGVPTWDLHGSPVSALMRPSCAILLARRPSRVTATKTASARQARAYSLFTDLDAAAVNRRTVNPDGP